MPDLLQQAISLHQTGQLTAAETAYRAVLQAQPDHADASALLGLVRGALGDHAEAIALTANATRRDPQSALFRFHLGTVQMNARHWPEAIAAFRQALQLEPDFAQAVYNLANALRAADDWPGAIAAYRQTIKLSPQMAEAYNNLALSLVHEKQFDEALAEARKAVEVQPAYGEGWRTLCNIAEQMKQYDLALQAGEHCIRLMPDSHFAWFGYGVALNRLDRNAEAIEAYKKALALKPERADIWDNLGQTYQALNRLEEAAATFRKTVEVAGQVIPDEDSWVVDERDYGNRHWHLALVELLRGDYKRGFKRYRARFKDVGGLKRPNFAKPVWQGESLSGKTILIQDEQGFGDTLMLARYLPLMRAQGAKVLFSVHPVLQPFFEGWRRPDGEPMIERLLVHGDKIGDYDLHASVFDLPYCFGTTLATIPQQIPYLPAPEPDSSCALPTDGRPRIGIVWGGSPLHLNDARRSVPLPLFAGLFDHRQLQFFSLNRDLKPGDAEALPRYYVTDLAPRLKNFKDAARFIMQLDLVITCDTATAHLAGGLGKPVWVLLPFAPDWRWLTDRNDTPWYPQARLFRQPQIGDWTSVIDAVSRALIKFQNGP